MYCALPSSLQTLLELAHDIREDDEFFFQFLDEFLKGLSVLGTSSLTLTGVRRHLQLLSSANEHAGEGAHSLEALLRQHDLLLGPDMGGFANLLRGAMDDDDVFAGDVIDFEGLDEGSKAQLRPIGEAAEELSALEDVAEAIGARADRVAACILFDGVMKWIPEATVMRWIQRRPHLEDTCRLIGLRSHLEGLSVDFVQRQLQLGDLRDFGLWFLARFLSGRTMLGPLERRLGDTLLRKAEIGSLETFEKAGFFK